MVKTEKRTRFGLMRHAPTEWNAVKRIQGNHDSPLTAAGRSQALQWGHRLRSLPWDRILSSDLGRARETARYVSEAIDLPVEEIPLLREQDWGAWTGMTFGAVREVFPEQMEEMEAHPWSFCPPGGENRVSVFERGVAALREAAGRWPGEKILVVTHEGMIKSLVYRMAETLPGGPGAFLIQPGHLHWLCWVDGAVAVERVNAVALGS